jgi:hypothetical protein
VPLLNPKFAIGLVAPVCELGFGALGYHLSAIAGRTDADPDVNKKDGGVVFVQRLQANRAAPLKEPANSAVRPFRRRDLPFINETGRP